MSIDLFAEILKSSEHFSPVTHPELLSDGLCCVYWIREKTCDDILEGYVGVTKDLRTRLSKHLRDIENIGKYHKDFIEAKRQGNLEISVEFVGQPDDCYSFEFQLRPYKGVGWNKHEGGRSQHMRSNDKAYKALKRLKNVAKGRVDLTVDPYLSTQRGIEEFLKMYDQNYANNVLIVLPEQGIVNLDTISFKSRSKMQREKTLHDFGGGVIRNISELAEELGVKPNTISTQIRRNWSYEKIVSVNSGKLLRGEL